MRRLPRDGFIPRLVRTLPRGLVEAASRTRERARAPLRARARRQRLRRRRHPLGAAENAHRVRRSILGAAPDAGVPALATAGAARLRASDSPRTAAQAGVDAAAQLLGEAARARQ